MIIAALAAMAFMAADPPAGSVTASTPASAGAKAAAEANPDQQVCVRTEQIGSRFPKVECRSRAEWRQLTQESKDLLNNITTQHQLASPLAGH